LVSNNGLATTKLTVSPLITPGSELLATVATRVESYSLLFAANDPDNDFAETVSVAALLVAEPQLFEKTARYCLPLRETGGLVKDSVAFVSLVIFVNVEPPFVLTCHCTVGSVPLAADVKDAF
jgi:hypothetical protein